MFRSTFFTTIFLALLLTTTHAQESVLSIFLADADPQPLTGTLIYSDASATTLIIDCPTDTPSDECGFYKPVTITAGPQTFHASYTLDSLTLVDDCKGTFTGESPHAVCIGTYIGSVGALPTGDGASLVTGDTDGAIGTGVVTSTLKPEEISLFPITIEGTASGAAISQTGSTSNSRTTSKGTQAGPGSSKTGSASKTEGGATPTGTNAAAGGAPTWSAILAVGLAGAAGIVAAVL